MLSIYDTASLQSVLAQPIDALLRAHLDRHIDTARRNGLSDESTHLLVIQPADTEWDIEEEIGFSPLVDMGGNRFRDPDFVPYWDHLLDLGGRYELLDTIGNSGFAFIILIDQDGVWPELFDLCRVHSR